MKWQKKADIPVWITEISDVNPLDISIHDGLKWAVTFSPTIPQSELNAIIWWGGAMPTSNNESLIILDKTEKIFYYLKRYDIFGNFSRYMFQKRVVLDTSNPV